MTRHQRRKAARVRKEAKAEIMLSRALHVLASEKTKANLSRSRCGERSGKLGNRSVYTGANGPTASGAQGQKLFDVANAELKNRLKPRKRAHSQFNGDNFAIEGQGLKPATVRAIYAETLSRSGYPKRDDAGYANAPRKYDLG